MTLLGYGLIAVGVVLFALGYARAREPYRRYRGLKAQDENAARYRAWRGGPSTAADEKTGASVAMAMLRREARIWTAIAIAGIVLVIVGLALAAG